MINYVVVDDINFYIRQIENTIKKIMFEKNNKYKIHSLANFGGNFWKIVESKLENVYYILDIEVKNINGIDVARKIRSIDNKAEILFVTAHDTEKYRISILTSSIKSVGFINKINLENELSKKIEEFIEVVNTKTTLFFKENNIIVNIMLEDILYIENKGRQTTIFTINNQFNSYKSLTYFENILKEKSNKFIRTSRNCIVNLYNVEKLDFKKEEITFKNNKTINSLSNKYKKEIEKKFD